MAAGDIGNNIRTYLLTKSEVTNLLGASGGIFSDVLPQRGEYTLPVIVYNVIAGISYRHLSGSAKAAQTTVQLDCIASTRLAANALAEAVRTVFECYSGAAGDDDIDIAQHTTPRYDYDPPKDASEDALFTTGTDYLVLHNNPAVLT